MITVTLGTIPFQFNRAIDWLDSLLASGVITEPVFVQHGVSSVSKLTQYPLVTTAPILEFNNLVTIVGASRLVISHAGQGSARGLAESKASFILIPRLARYGEHVDDHQLQFARSVEPLGVKYCLSLEELEQAVKNPPPRFQKSLLKGPKLVDHLLQVYPSNQFAEQFS